MDKNRDKTPYTVYDPLPPAPNPRHPCLHIRVCINGIVAGGESKNTDTSPTPNILSSLLLFLVPLARSKAFHFVKEAVVLCIVTSHKWYDRKRQAKASTGRRAGDQLFVTVKARIVTEKGKWHNEIHSSVVRRANI